MIFDGISAKGRLIVLNHPKHKMCRIQVFFCSQYQNIKNIKCVGEFNTGSVLFFSNWCFVLIVNHFMRSFWMSSSEKLYLRSIVAQMYL
mmetsp:Transcript_93901/g.140713  ORF Transcript_93901/g.140713 Transcript_93901/m.140713 type:complete len:89 (+) Transcript_93901:44-310(+)